MFEELIEKINKIEANVNLLLELHLEQSNNLTTYNDVAMHTVRPKTWDGYESLVRVHINPEIGHIRLTNLRPDHLQNFYSNRLAADLSSPSWIFRLGQLRG